MSKKGEGGEEWEEGGAAVQQLRGRALSPVVEEGAEGGGCNSDHVEAPGRLEGGG